MERPSKEREQARAMSGIKDQGELERQQTALVVQQSSVILTLTEASEISPASNQSVDATTNTASPRKQQSDAGSVGALPVEPAARVTTTSLRLQSSDDSSQYSVPGAFSSQGKAPSKEGGRRTPHSTDLTDKEESSRSVKRTHSTDSSVSEPSPARTTGAAVSMRGFVLNRESAVDDEVSRVGAYSVSNESVSSRHWKQGVLPEDAPAYGTAAKRPLDADSVVSLAKNPALSFKNLKELAMNAKVSPAGRKPGLASDFKQALMVAHQDSLAADETSKAAGQVTTLSRHSDNVPAFVGARAVPGPGDPFDASQSVVTMDTALEPLEESFRTDGAVTAKALSNEDYEAELRELIRQNAVEAREVTLADDDDEVSVPPRKRGPSFYAACAAIPAAIAAVLVYIFVLNDTGGDAITASVVSPTPVPTFASTSSPVVTSGPTMIPTSAPTLTQESQNLLDFFTEVSFDGGAALRDPGSAQRKYLLILQVHQETSNNSLIPSLFVVCRNCFLFRCFERNPPRRSRD